MATSYPLKVSVGFIGAGRMCQALSKGFSDAGLVGAAKMICSDVGVETLASVAKDLGIRTTTSNVEVVQSSDVIFIAVKPNMVAEVLTEVSSVVDGNPDKLFVSIAAGITLNQLEQVLPKGTRVIRVMPNTPALVHCAASVYSKGTHATTEDEVTVKTLFECLGYCTSLPEKHLDAVTALSGSGPAYIFLAIESMADGGVKMGLPRDIAQRLAAQTVMGAAKMVLDTGRHPGQLKDDVCSPGGTTIAGVHHLEQSGYRSALIGAVEAATKRSIELGKM